MTLCEKHTNDGIQKHRFFSMCQTLVQQALKHVGLFQCDSVFAENHEHQATGG